MNSKTKTKKLITRSILLTAKKREFLLALLESLTEAEADSLTQVLQSESESIRNFLEANFANDPSGKLLKRFDEFMRTGKREILVEAEERGQSKEQTDQDAILQEISKA